MAERLTDLYQPGDAVEIWLGEDALEAGWRPGTVIGPAFPGIWVATADGGRWFVTNRRRIRQAPPGRHQDA